MIIKIDGKLFTVDPDERFSSEQNLPIGFWKDLWRRYKFLDYTTTDLTQYFHLRSGRKTTYMTMQRWIFRTEIYNKARPFVKMGATTASTEIFCEFEDELIKELTRQFKSSVKGKRRIIV